LLREQPEPSGQKNIGDAGQGGERSKTGLKTIFKKEKGEKGDARWKVTEGSKRRVNGNRGKKSASAIGVLYKSLLKKKN